MVSSGLRELPDIDAPEVEDRLWLPAERNDH